MRPQRELRVVLVGFGRVGQEFAVLLNDARGDLNERFGVDVVLAGIRTRASEIRRVFDVVPARSEWSTCQDFRGFLESTNASILVQAIPSGEESKVIALDQALVALDTGLDIVTATKSAVASHWGELAEAATAVGRRIRISAAAGAALPAFDVARRSLRGFGCREIRSCSNGTSTFVLDQLAAGRTLDESMRQAAAQGIAEQDPSGDLDGRDAAAKIVLLANVLWDLRANVDDVVRDAIDSSTLERVQVAARRGHRLRAVASANRAAGTLAVRLEETAQSDPMYRLVGPEKAVAFDCGGVGQVVVSGGKSSPRGAAHALLKDILDLAADGAAGFG
jgi:homoserine dehydrogenase